MRKNLTISLSSEDWRKVRAITRSRGETYSRVFHEFVAMGAVDVVSGKRAAKYKALLSPQAAFLESRAGVLARAGRKKRR